MYRFLALVAVAVSAASFSGAAHGQGLMTCMEEARQQKVAETEAGTFIRDCMAKQQGGTSFGAPKDAATSAPAPPDCADKNMLGKVRTQIQFAEEAKGEKLLEIGGVREVLLGAPPRSANQYATATTFIAISRYCEGTATLASGPSEPVHWRIDTVKDGADTSTRVDFCSARHDAFQNGCAHVIAGKEK